MDEATLSKIVNEIAALLCKQLPEEDAILLNSEVIYLKSKICAQLFAFKPGQGGVFSINAELHHSPSVPGELNLKRITTK